MSRDDTQKLLDLHADVQSRIGQEMQRHDVRDDACLLSAFGYYLASDARCTICRPVAVDPTDQKD